MSHKCGSNCRRRNKLPRCYTCRGYGNQRTRGKGALSTIKRIPRAGKVRYAGAQQPHGTPLVCLDCHTQFLSTATNQKRCANCVIARRDDARLATERNIAHKALLHYQALKAKELRADGWKIKDIAAELGVVEKKVHMLLLRKAGNDYGDRSAPT